jgi:hypothetical protein
MRWNVQQFERLLIILCLLFFIGINAIGSAEERMQLISDDDTLASYFVKDTVCFVENHDTGEMVVEVWLVFDYKEKINNVKFMMSRYQLKLQKKQLRRMESENYDEQWNQINHIAETEAWVNALPGSHGKTIYDTVIAYCKAKKMI